MARIPVIHVTDHALLRHLERVLMLDLDQIRRDIVDQVENGEQQWGKYVTGPNGITYILNDAGSVVTLFDESKPVKQARTKPKAGRHNVSKQLNGHNNEGRFSTRNNRLALMGKKLSTRSREEGQ